MTIKKFIPFIIFAVLFLSAACALPSLFGVDDANSTTLSVANLILTSDPNATPTRTPFMPMAQTPLPSATLGPTPTPTSSPTPQPPTPSPMPTFQGVALPTGRVNIMVMGSDSRGDGGYRTDVMLLVSINPTTGAVSLISFPRDLWVTIPGIGEQRLNTAMEFGGFSLYNATMEQNFGIHLDYYFLTDFYGFQNLINNLGGVTVNTNTYLTDHCDLPQADAEGYCYIAPGQYQMDGATALWYVRSRYSTSDLDRLRRAQEVIIGVFNKLMSLDALSRVGEIFSNYSSYVETNMSLNDILSVAPIAPGLISNNGLVHQYSLGSGYVTGYIIPSSGANVLLPNYEAINSLLLDAFSQ